jgi:hypothetical protein
MYLQVARHIPCSTVQYEFITQEDAKGYEDEREEDKADGGVRRD